jgi:O-antigen/teichoic acid export membrane protein
MGISTSLMIEYYHMEREKERKAVISTAVIVSCLPAASISALLFFTAGPLSNILFSTWKWTYAVRLASISFFFMCISSIGFSFLRTRQQPVKFRLVSISSAVGAALLNIFFIAYLHHGAVGFFEASVIVGVLEVSILMFWTIRYAGKIHFQKNIYYSLLKLGWPDIPVRLSGWALTSANRYFLAILASIAQVGLFSLAYRISSILDLLFITIISYAFFPYILSHMKDTNFFSIYRRLTAYIMMFGTLLALLISGTAKDVIILMARNKSFWPAYQSVSFLAVGSLLNGFYFTYRPILGIIKKPSLAIPGLVAAAAVNAGLNYLLVPSLGAQGSALSLIAAYIIATLQIHYAVKHHYPLTIPWAALIRIFLAGVLCFGLLTLLPTWHPMINLFLKIGIILTIYPVFLCFLGTIDDSDRKTILNRVGRIRCLGKAATILLSLDIRKIFR